MAEQGVILDIDTKFLKRLEQADAGLTRIAESAEKMGLMVKLAFNTVSKANVEVLNNLAKQWSALSNIKFKPEADTSSVEKFGQEMDNILNSIKALLNYRQDLGFELFDPTSLGITNQSVRELEEQLLDVNERLQEVRENLADIGTEEGLLKGFSPSVEFTAPINPRTKEPYKSGKKYDAALAEYNEQYGAMIEAERNAYKEQRRLKEQGLALDYELEERALQNTRKVLEQRLAYAKKTELEKAKVIQDASEKEIRSAQITYGSVLKEMTSLMKKSDRAEKKNEDGALDEQIRGYQQRFLELNNRKEELENQYGVHLVEVAKRANAQILDIQVARIYAAQREEEKARLAAIDAERRTPQGAYNYAQQASTINEMKKAQKYLQEARGDVDVKDEDTIRLLNDEYIRLRATIESLTTAEKNEQSLQPTLRNEYMRLRKELDTLTESMRKYSQIDTVDDDAYDALIAREKDLQDKIAQIRNNAGDLLAETDRQYEAQKAQVAVDEYAKAEQKKLELAKQRLREELAETSKSGSISSASADRLIQIATGASNVTQDEIAVKKLTDALKHLDRNSANYNKTVAKLNRQIKLHEHNIKRATDAQYRENEAKKAADRYNSSRSGALAYSQAAQSITEQIQAIKYLKTARENLNRSSFANEVEYRKAVKELTNEINRQEKSVQDLTNKNKDLGNAHKGLLNTADQLKRALMGIFSISAIKGYVSQLARVRGEFELQQRSLQALLQNKDEANKLWEQTVKLAVRSPFQVSQLVRSTKQLAAYRIESEKLYETNKMLADISAGVGVEIERLILAFGQVKAANFLRGTELRQFSEAGINVLGELAEYYTQLEGRMVSVGDVFERVSKRMVSFADVETVLKRVTSAGGQFYNMQEIQANTLRGQISNLKDQIELMLNDIGKSNEGVLKGSVGAVRMLAENWRGVATVLKTVGAALILNKLATLETKTAWFELAEQLGAARKDAVGNVESVNLLKFAWRNVTKSINDAATAIGKFFTAHPIIAAITAILSVLWKIGTAIYDLRKEIKRIEKDFDDLRDKVKSIDVQFNIFVAEKKIESARGSLLNLIKLAEEDYGLKYNIDVESMDLASVESTFAEIAKKVFDANFFAEEFAKSVAKYDVADKWGLSDWINDFVLDNTMLTDLTQYGEQFQKTFKMIYGDINNVVYALQHESIALSDTEQEALKSLQTFKQKGETEEAYMSRIIKAYEELQGAIQLTTAENSKLDRNLRRFKRRTREAEKEFSKFLRKNKDFAEMDAAELKVAIDKFAFDKGYSDIVEKLYELANEAYNVQIVPTIYEPEQDFEEWAKRVRPAVEGLNEEIKKTLPEESDIQLFPLPEKGQTKEAYLSLAKEVIGIAEATYAEGQQIEDEATVARTNALKSFAKSFKAILNIFDKTGGDTETDTRWSDLIKVVKEANKEFKSMNNSLGATTAKMGVIAKFKDPLNDVLSKVKIDGKSYTAEEFMKDFDLTSEDGMTKILDKIAEIAPKAADKLKAELAKADIVWEGKIIDAKKADADLEQEIEDMFSGYELSIELGKLNIPSDFAEQFFGLEAVSLEGLKEKVDYAFTGVEFYSERIKDAGEIMRETFKGNVDLLNRELIPAQELAKKGWEDVGDGIATVFSSTYSVQDASGKMVDILVTPILPNGTVLSQKELEDYIAQNIEGAQDILKADKKGIIIHSGEGLNKDIGDYLHSLQEVYYAMDMLTENQKAKYKEHLQKVKKMEAKAQQERLKKYLQYSRDAIGERAKIKLEELKQLQEIEQTFTGDDETSQMAKQKAIGHIQEESYQKDQKQQWEEFQKSDLFLSLFNDLDNASNKLLEHSIAKLEEFKNQWRDMPLEDMKTIVEKINQLEDQLIENQNPFEATRTLKDERAKDPRTDEQITQDNIAESNKIVAAQAEIALLEQILTLQQEGNMAAAADVAVQAGRTELFGAQAEELQGQLDAQKDIVANSTKNIAQNNQTLNINNKIRKSYQKQAEAIKDAQKMANDLYGAFKDLSEVLGADSDSPAAVFADMGMSMANAVLDTIALQFQLTGAKTAADMFSASMNSSMGIIGWIVMAVQLLATALKAAFAAHDNKLQKQIERDQEAIEALSKKLEKLEESLDKAFSTKQLEAYSDEIESNIERQIDAYDRMIAAEQDKKKTNDDQIKQWQQEQEELIEALDDMRETVFSKAIAGVLDDALDAARGFVDAWYEAFQETGEGLKGLEENFKEMLLEIVKQQAAMTIVGVYTDKYKDMLKEYVNDDDAELSAEEAKEWAEKVKATFPELNAALEGMFDGFGNLIEQSGELSDLSKGIQGVTETTAQVIEAYLNSVRFYVADSNVKLTQIANSVLGDGPDNPMLEQLKAIAQQTSAINELLKSVTKMGGHSSGGSGIKVFISD